MAEIFNKDISVLGGLTINPSNGAGSILTISGTNVITFRTPSEVLSDIGASPEFSTFAELDTLVTDKSLINLNDGGIFLSDISVPDDAYDAGWNGNESVPTKNAIYDKIESLSGGHDAVTLSGPGTYLTLVGQDINVGAITESDISDLQSYSLIGHTHPATDISFSSYLSITSVNIQLAIEELKDEIDLNTTLIGSAEEEEINFVGGETTWVLSEAPSVLFPHRLYAGTTSGGGLILLDEGIDYTISGATITYLSPVLPIDPDEKHIIHYNLPQAPSGYSDPNSDVKIRNADMYDVINTNAYYKDGHVADQRNLQLMVVTDVHGDVTAVQNAITMMNEFSTIDGGLNLGDTCTNTWLDDFTFIDPLLNIGKPFLNVIGNHDEGLGYVVADTGSTAASYARFVQPYESSIGGTHAGKSYYYKDWTTYKIRTIVLYEYDDNDDLNLGDSSLYRVVKTTRVWSQAQIDWLITTLNNTPSDYAVVIAMHQIVQDQINWTSSNFTDINHISPGDSSTSVDEAIIPEIIDAWINGTTLVSSYAFSGDASYKTNISVNADFTSRGVGHFICYMAGHAHVDVIGTVTGYSDQTQIVLTCTTSDSNRNRYGDLQRQSGKRSEDCINIVSFDTTNRQIKIARIGAQITHDMRKRDFIAIDY